MRLHLDGNGFLSRSLSHDLDVQISAKYIMENTSEITQFVGGMFVEALLECEVHNPQLQNSEVVEERM